MGAKLCIGNSVSAQKGKNRDGRFAWDAAMLLKRDAGLTSVRIATDAAEGCVSCSYTQNNLHCKACVDQSWDRGKSGIVVGSLVRQHTRHGDQLQVAFQSLEH